jgi:hypothetical protein
MGAGVSTSLERRVQLGHTVGEQSNSMLRRLNSWLSTPSCGVWTAIEAGGEALTCISVLRASKLRRKIHDPLYRNMTG